MLALLVNKDEYISTSERLVVELLTIGAIQVHFLSFRYIV